MDKIKLYHYSNSNFKGYVKPSFFGLNSYSYNSVKLSGVKRSYFYLEPKIKEYYLQGSKFLYITEIDKNKLYNLDSNKIISDDIYTEAKKQGYIGIYNKEQVVLFKAVKIKAKITLTKV